jgi:hypothetical protein
MTAGQHWGTEGQEQNTCISAAELNRSMLYALATDLKHQRGEGGGACTPHDSSGSEPRQQNSFSPATNGRCPPTPADNHSGAERMMHACGRAGRSPACHCRWKPPAPPSRSLEPAAPPPSPAPSPAECSAVQCSAAQCSSWTVGEGGGAGGHACVSAGAR